MPAISVLMKPASGLCNMRCDYCFYCDEMAHRKQESYGYMSEATLKNIIRKTMLRAEGAISFAYQGGEPTLRGMDFFREAVRLQRQYNKGGLQISNAFQTNGLLIDEDWCRFFAENRFLVGISIDGTAAIHDSLRHDASGKATWDRVQKSTRLMDRFGVDYNILTVVTAEVAEHIEEIYAEYQRRGWKWLQFIPCLDPLPDEALPGGQSLTDQETESVSSDAAGTFPGSSAGDSSSAASETAASEAPAGKPLLQAPGPFSLTPKAYGRFLIRLFKCWYADLKKGRQPYIRQFENWVGILLGVPPEACDQRGVCGIQYVVEADGGVYPCDFYMLDEWKLGNFNEDRLDTLDTARLRSGFLSASRKAQEDCRDCRYFALCRGGCQRHRVPVSGEDGLLRNRFCESYRMFFDACEEDLLIFRSARSRRH